MTHPLVDYVKGKFMQADRARRPKRDQWTKNLKAMRGADSGSSMRPESEVSKIYVRTTTTKTKAAYAQINEAILAGDKFPISVMPTSSPEGIMEYAHIETKAPESNPLDVGFEGDGNTLKPGARFGNAYESIQEEQVVEGPDPSGGPILTPAKEAAIKMERKIQDQLTESKARLALRRALYEQCMLGTGAMKGPFTEIRNVNSWDEEGNFVSSTKELPTVSFVSIWDLYVDPNAYNNEDIQWLVERHRLNYNQFVDLQAQPEFETDAINRVAAYGGNYEQQDHENTLHENNETESESELFEVFEYWGYMSPVTAKAHGIETPENSTTTVLVNTWVCGNEVIRLVVNPFAPARIPYFIFPYEEDPYSIYGTGIPELMEDLQYLMNGMTRLAVENAMLAGNVILDVDKSALANEADMKIYPGKIFERQSGAPGQAINAIEIPFVAHQNMQMFSQFRQMADESTGIQSILHGQTGISGTGRTASGLSMLMDSASMSIKNVIRNIDEHLLKPMAVSYFQWNMQFLASEFPEIRGDLDIKPLGSFNLVSKERKAQSLQTFLSLSTNQAIAPLIRLPNIIKDLAIQMDMKPDEILNSPEEAAAYVKLMEAMNPTQQGQATAPPTAAPAPGMEGFTGNTAGAGNVEGTNGQPPLQ